jgi:N-acyl-D-aspartate/D-glutamate deacylase
MTRSLLTHRALASALAVVAAACGPASEYDLILRGGTLLDGTGAEARVGDVAIRGDRIAAVGDLGRARGTEEVDVTGLMVAPGFIHLHSHAEPEGLAGAVNMLSQGVTTEIMNPDGGGPLDLPAQFAELEAGGLAVNVGGYIGFNRVWYETVGPDDRRPTAAQIEAMQAQIQAGLEAGAWGVSAGLDYKPAYYAHMDEVVAVLTPVGRWGTVFTNHDRLTPESGYSSRVGMQETVDIGEAAGLRPVITHMKIQGREQGTSPEVLQWMRDTEARGVPVAADVYPYLAGQTGLSALIIPGWAQAGGREAMLARFGDPALRTRIVAEADEAMAARFGGPSGVFLLSLQRELTDVMADMGAATGGEAVIRLLEDDEHGVILRFGSEEDLSAILRHPTASISCDCGSSLSTRVHPRYWGTHPRVLGRYVRELGVLSWEDAVRKMTGLPAATIGMEGRGTLAPDMAADIVVFDPTTIIDHATYEDPTAMSDGIVHVLVNGEVAWRDGAATGAQAGRVLRKPNPLG